MGKGKEKKLNQAEKLLVDIGVGDTVVVDRTQQFKSELLGSLTEVRNFISSTLNDMGNLVRSVPKELSDEKLLGDVSRLTQVISKDVASMNRSIESIESNINSLKVINLEKSMNLMADISSCMDDVQTLLIPTLQQLTDVITSAGDK